MSWWKKLILALALAVTGFVTGDVVGGIKGVTDAVIVVGDAIHDSVPADQNDEASKN